MRPYHPENLSLQPFAHWRVIVLAHVGKWLGIQFKIDGIPYGAKYDPAWRVDRAGTVIKPERKVVLRGRQSSV